MKKTLIASIFFVVLLGTLSAEPLKPKFPWDCPSPKGNVAYDTITTGFILDCVGYGFVMGSSAGFAISPGLGRIFLDIGCTGYTVGGIVMDAGVEKRHQAITKMKYKIKTANRAKSRRLTFYTELSAGVGVGAASRAWSWETMCLWRSAA